MLDYVAEINEEVTMIRFLFRGQITENLISDLDEIAHNPSSSIVFCR